MQSKSHVLDHYTNRALIGDDDNLVKNHNLHLELGTLYVLLATQDGTFTLLY